MAVYIGVVVLVLACLAVAMVAYTKRDRSKDWETTQQRQKRQLDERIDPAAWERKFQEREADDVARGRQRDLPPTHEPRD